MEIERKKERKEKRRVGEGRGGRRAWGKKVVHAVRFELTRVAPLDLESNALDRSAIHASSGFRGEPLIKSLSRWVAQ